MQKSASANGSLAITGNKSASNRTPRQINRNLIFSLIRMWQPVSRAELSRRSGLRRSTVSLIVEELIREQWVFEGEVGKLPRGRRPVLVQLNEQRGVLAVDIHPTQTTIAIADLTGKTTVHSVVDLGLEQKDALQTIVQGLQRLIKEHQGMSFVGVGVCLPGRVDPAQEASIFAPRLKWPSMDIKEQVGKGTGLPVEMDNVANACALAEVWFGDSDANDGLIVVNVSEGIAVGIFANREILRGQKGMAGEFGHIQLQADGGVPCACGNVGCWETLASNTAALRYHRELAGEHAAPSFGLLVKLAMGGQPAAVEALTRSAKELGRGMRVLLSGLAPREIVIVGEMAEAWSLLGPIVEAEMQRGMTAPAPVLRCTPGGEDARLRGAVALILSKGSV